MVKVEFPSIYFPSFIISKGLLLDVELLGIKLHIPPWNITFWNSFKLLNGFTLFDTNDIFNPIAGIVNAIPKAVWNLAKSSMDTMADDFYKKHSTYKDYIKERKK